MDDLCGFPIRQVRIPGLRPEIAEINEWKRLLLFDKGGIKWEIRQHDTKTLSLYHRSEGRKNNHMHYQRRSATATYGGVERLLAYVLHHEQYEKKGRRL